MWFSVENKSFLAGLFHIIQLLAIKRELVDLAPIERGGIHRETRGDSAVGSEDHVVLTGAAVPFAEPQLAVFILARFPRPS